MCGCSGNHRYASAHREIAGKERGYVVDDDEVNDRQVMAICNKIEQAFRQHNSNPDIKCGADAHYVYADVGNRSYVAYAGDG